MSRLLRHALLGAGLLGIVAVYAGAAVHLPPVGHYPGPYGYQVNALSVSRRKVTDAVTLVNFDARGFDTLGEEFILFTSVLGTVLLLRMISDPKRREGQDEALGRHVPPPSDAVTALALRMIGPLVILGLYVVAHGQISPGGGFQGGVVLATAPLMLYLAESYEAFKSISNKRFVEIIESIGASGYAIIGLAGLVAGGVFLFNFLPFGQPEKLLSAGTTPLISLAVGMEVAGGIVLLLSAFLEEMLAAKAGGEGETG